MCAGAGCAAALLSLLGLLRRRRRMRAPISIPQPWRPHPFPLPGTRRYVLQFDDDIEVEWSVNREQADGPFALDVGQRIWLYVRPEAMMAFDQEEVESTPIV